MAVTAESARIAVRAPKELVDAFARVAAANDRSVSGELRRLMRERVSTSRRDEEVGPTST